MQHARLPACESARLRRRAHVHAGDAHAAGGSVGGEERGVMICFADVIELVQAFCGRAAHGQGSGGGG